MNRPRKVLLSVIFLSVCSLYMFWQRTEDLKEETKNNILEEGLYYRDHHGYLYKKEYFQFLPIDQANLFQNLSLNGRHSDTVLSPCHHSNGNPPEMVKDEYKMTNQFNYDENFKNPCWYEGGDKLNKTLRCIPYYYFIGSPKAGSTDLFWRIGMHPDIVEMSHKEHRWFDAYRFSEKEGQSIDYYVHRFDRAARHIRRAKLESGNNHRIVGDGSPAYLFNNGNWPLLPGNERCVEPRVLSLSYIHNLFPSAMLILIVRNPVDRLYSDYLFNSKRSGANKTAEEFHAWTKETIHNYEECFKSLPFRHCLYDRKVRFQSKVHSFTASIYSRLILDVLKLFPRNQLLVLQMEDYSANMAERLKEVFAFLGLDPLPEHEMKMITEMRQYNKGKHYQQSGSMLPATRRMIYNFYKPFNEELAILLNDDKYLWHED